jgi:hypothetical protein
MSNLVRSLTRIPQQNPHTTLLVTLFSFGAFAGSLYTHYSWVRKLKRKRLEDRENSGATREFNDLSLFYGDEDQLTKVERNCSHLPDDFYGALVRDCIVTCVDTLIVRRHALTDTLEHILVERRYVMQTSKLIPL